MIQRQLKLKLTRRQERDLERWLYHLTAVWNWAIKKIENDARDGIYYRSLTFQNLLNGHAAKIGVPQDALAGTLQTAYASWQRCFKKLARQPRLKGRRNRLTSIAFAHGTKLRNNRVRTPTLGWIRFYKQEIPEGHVGQMRIVKRASGWYLCLFIQAEASPIQAIADGKVGVDPGFTHLLTLSTGEKVAHPRELEASASRLAQAQRGSNRQLTARIQERTANQRKDRNHKLSHRLVAENTFISFSKDRIRSIARRFGKSVASSGHFQLRSMLAYKIKCRTDGLGTYVEPQSENSTRTCSACGALTGPTGWVGLSVREWDCAACGAHHDRDINSGMNALISGAGLAHEMSVKAA